MSYSCQESCECQQHYFRLIANSAPHMNNVILGGTILMALTTISLSFDSNYPREFEISDTVNATISKEAKDSYSSWCIVS